MMVKLCCSILVLVLLCTSVNGQDCPQNWKFYQNYCWFFSLSEYGTQPELSWQEAESFCQKNGGHLASYSNVDEENWVYQQNLRKYQDTKWWIGLNDLNYEGNWEWIDQSVVYDPSISKWRIGEPNNDAEEDCVETWVYNPVYPAMWNDKSCDRTNKYICKAPSGQSTKCPTGWTERSGSDSCYQAIRAGLNWHEADAECVKQGAWLVSIQSQQEQDFLNTLLQNLDDKNFYIGYSDTVQPGTLAWVDPSAANNYYTNWNTAPSNPLPYLGSTCIWMSKDNGYKWSTTKCSDDGQFVCERGLRGDCPAGWTLLGGKCYEVVTNPNRRQTWTNAKMECQKLGADMLKIESDEEQTYFAIILEGIRNQGTADLWLGASDIGSDGQWKWADGTAIQNYYWADGFPSNIVGRDDCLTLYTGKNIYNWEHGDCFRQLPYICTVPEGSKLAPSGNDHITIDGNCDEGWRHYNGKCYFFADTTTTQSDAVSACQNMNAQLTSILDPNEQSFIVGHTQMTSWIGLQNTGSGYTWLDGALSTTFQNWAVGAPKTQPCVQCGLTGEWKDISCSQPSAYICKKDDNEGTQIIDPPTAAPGDVDKCGGGGWFSDPTSTQCYLVNTEVARTWYDARSACQSKGGDLVSINSPDEQAFIQGFVNGLPTVVNIWIGLIDANPFSNDILDLADSGWAWSDGSPLPFINWNAGEPNNAGDEDCGELYVGDGTWNDINCYGHRHYICEKTGDMSSIIGDPDETITCQPHQECCFRHLGAEYGGDLPDDAIVASSEADYYFRAARGRLNTPDDVIDFDKFTKGQGHGGWKSASGDQAPWLQVDFPIYKTVKGIITQGRNGIGQITDRDWVTKFQVAFSEDAKHKGAEVTNWEYITGVDGQPITYDGNHDQNTEITNLFPREIVALHMRLYVIEYNDEPIIRLEYIGCSAACTHPLGMSNGLFLDSAITASSTTGGHEAKQARPKSVKGECLQSSSDLGTDYVGYISRTVSGIECQPWGSQTPHSHNFKPENYPDAKLFANQCRNPDGRSGGPWCYTSDPAVEWESCAIPVCPAYTPTGWTPSVPSGSWVQVGFGDYYKVNGITVFGSTSQYVKSYSIAFSDDGVNFKQYKNQANIEHIFQGLDGQLTYYTDILREAVGTKFLRIYPKTYQGSIVFQFEVNGCYNDRRITCTDTAKEFDSRIGEDVVIDCPAGCAQDPAAAPVYGGDPNYSDLSGVCLAAIHYGVLDDQHGGSVTYRKATGQNAYTGSFQNNVMSLDGSASTDSITFEGKVYRCDNDDDWVNWKDHCYYFSPKGIAKTWHDARVACQDMGADLVSIGSKGENDFIEAVIWQGDRGGDVWIGFNDQLQQNYYQWADGLPVTYTKWSFNEPNGGGERCTQFIRLEGYWNDFHCDEVIPYMCKKPKQLLPKIPEAELPVEEGCDPGWKAFESSCYKVSDHRYIFRYGQELCEEDNANMVDIHNDYEQAFVHSLVASSFPVGLNYTTWIGLAAQVSDSGEFVYKWESKQPTTYTNWNKNQPDPNYQCVFPFNYKGKTYYECATEDHPGRGFIRDDDTPWCSLVSDYQDPYWLNCGTKSEFACTYFDPLTGFWNTDICGRDYYYVCEKPRVGYEQPVYTTPNPNLDCAPGWLSDTSSSYCYQVMEPMNENERWTWQGAVDYCRSIGSDLVSVHSAAEQQTIVNIVQQRTSNSFVYFWIGLNNLNNEIGYQWSDASPVDYTFWNTGEPNNAGGIENCAEGQFYQTTDGWNDLPCTEKRNAICKIAKGQTPVQVATEPPLIGEEDPACGTDYTWIRYQTSLGADKCYLFKDTDERMTWSQSNDFCRSLGGQLVAVHSDDENVMLTSRTLRSSAGSFWIGLHDIGGRAFTWADNTILDYVNWAPGEPNNYYDSEGCANFYSDSGLWNDENCGTDNFFICEKFMNSQAVTVPPTPPQQGNCPQGFTSFGNNCYLSSEKTVMNWDNARAWCKERGGDLAAITNDYEQAFLINYLWGDANNFWIGLTDRGTGYYVWIDQADFIYTNWQPGEPSGGDEGCVEMRITSDVHGLWNDLDCSVEYPFVCYARKDASLPAPPATPSTIGCPDGYYTSAESKSCFKLMSTPSSWQQARENCQSQGEGFDLASISELYDNYLLYSWFFQQITTDSVWIGLQFNVDDKSARVTYSWSDGWPLTYTSWDVSQPSGSVLQTLSGCGKMNSNGNWELVADSQGSVSCNTPMPYVCKKNLAEIPPPAADSDGSVGTCDPDWKYQYGSDCYYIEYGTKTSETRSWVEAEASCQSRGGDLASFHSKDEIDEFDKQLDGLNSHNLWIGLYSDGFDGWTWSDGSPVDFFNWGPNEPNGQVNEECVEMYPWDGTWNDVSCLEKRGFVCQRPKTYSQCSIAFSKRQECGFAGIDEDYCVEKRGCCWDPTFVGGNISGCFYPKSGGIAPEPNSDSGSSGLSGGAIFGIIVAVVLAGVLGFVAWKFGSGGKSISSPMSWSSSSTTKSAAPAKEPSSGFDNPMALGDSSA